jgi:hypothetical protein
MVLNGVRNVIQLSNLYPNLVLLRQKSVFEKLKRYKSPATDQSLAEMIQAGGNALHLEIHKLINLIRTKEDLPQQ